MNEKPLDEFSWSGERLTRKETTSRLDALWPEIGKDMSDASKRREKQKWAIKNPKLDNARRLRGIYFIDADDEEFKDMMKNARQRDRYRETCRTVEEHRRKYACSVEADESMRKRMEGSGYVLPKHKWPKSWSSMEDPVVPLDRNLYGHHLAGLLWEKQFEKVLLEHGWEKFQVGTVHSLTERKD